MPNISQIQIGETLYDIKDPNVTGVYVGSGEVPKNCDVQIDPSGEFTMPVMTVNGTAPDASGNIELALRDSSGGEVWEEIINLTTEEEISCIIKDLDNPGKFKQMCLYASLVGVATNTTGQTGLYIGVNSKGQWDYLNSGKYLVGVSNAVGTGNVTHYWTIQFTPTFTKTITNSGQYDIKWTNVDYFTNDTVIKTIVFGTQNWVYKFGVGTVIKLYGVRA